MHDSEKTVVAVRMAPMGGGTPRNASSGSKAGLERMKDHRVTTNLESVLFQVNVGGWVVRSTARNSSVAA